jgi:hypothetical protein
VTVRKYLSLPGARLFLAVLLVYSVCPPFTSNDSYFVVPTALSLLRHGSFAVDEFVAAAPPEARYAVECVPASGTAAGSLLPCPGGHWYNFYPQGVPVLVLPVVAALRAATGLLAALVPALPHISSRPIIAAFLSGDLVGGNAIVQLLAAALISALAAWFVFLIAARYLSSRESVLLTLLFAFGTSQFSISSRNLFQHGPSVLMLTLTLYLVLRAEDDPRLVRYAALPLAFAFVLRPSNFVAVLIFTAFVAWRYPKQMPAFLLCTLPVALPFFANNLVDRHSLFPTYYHPTAAGRNPFWFGFRMNLFSPSRGLLVYTPIVLFSAAGMVLAWRRRWCWPLAPFLAVLVLGHMLLIASYWSGHSYGPRYWADITPFFVFFLIPVVRYSRDAAGRLRTAAVLLFFLLAGWGVLVHTRGATSVAAQQWSMFPVNVDQARDRVFDWSDPQFLRGLK